jgi:hypothetical protein
MIEPPVAGVKYVHASKTELQSDELHDNWLVNSGASHIMSSCQEWFHQYIPLTKPIKVVLGDNSAIIATSVGHIFVRMHNGSRWFPAILQDILHVPDLHGNLLSVSHFNHHGNEIHFTNQRCELLDKSRTITCVSHLQGSLYQMDIKVTKGETTHLAHIDVFPSEGSELPIPEPDTYMNVAHANLTTWHRCLGHIHTDTIKHMVDKRMVTGMKLNGDEPPSAPCEPCIKAKQAQKPIHKMTNTHTDSVLGRIFSNVCGKMSTWSYQGFKYFVTWVDNNLCKVFVHGLRQKSDVEQALKAFVSHAEVKTGMPVQALHSDGGGEYTAGSVQSYLSAKGIKHEITTPDTPQHNGVAERMNRTLLDKV